MTIITRITLITFTFTELTSKNLNCLLIYSYITANAGSTSTQFKSHVQHLSLKLFLFTYLNTCIENCNILA